MHKWNISSSSIALIWKSFISSTLYKFNICKAVFFTIPDSEKITFSFRKKKPHVHFTNSLLIFYPCSTWSNFNNTNILYSFYHSSRSINNSLPIQLLLWHCFFRECKRLKNAKATVSNTILLCIVVYFIYLIAHNAARAKLLHFRSSLIIPIPTYLPIQQQQLQTQTTLITHINHHKRLSSLKFM